jgi:hypothetical protein
MMIANQKQAIADLHPRDFREWWRQTHRRGMQRMMREAGFSERSLLDFGDSVVAAVGTKWSPPNLGRLT